MKNTKNEKKDCYSAVALCQLMLCALLLLSVFFLSGESVRADYRQIMSKTYTRDDFTAIVSKVSQYFSEESSLKKAFSESFVTVPSEEAAEEETTEETYSDEEISEENALEALPMGGSDITLKEVPSNCSFAPIMLTTPLVSPVEKGRYTSYFGFRTNPVTGEYGFHTGFDIAAEAGTVIRAALSGRVTKVGEDNRAGKYLILTHGSGLQTFYCHCSEILAEDGANIRQGETVALVGSTGMSTGPHLHFEIRKDNIRFNPLSLLVNAD